MPGKYHLIVVPEGEHPYCHELGTFQELRDKIQEIVGTEARIFVFRGDRYQVTPPPFRYLVASEGESWPLFTIPEAGALAVLPDGYIGGDPSEVALSPIEHVVEDDTSALAPDIPVIPNLASEDDEIIGGADLFGD